MKKAFKKAYIGAYKKSFKGELASAAPTPPEEIPEEA